MGFEWDDEKNQRNSEERDVSFSYASRAFRDKRRVTIEDDRRDYGEVRYLTFGHISERLYVVGHTPRGKKTRIFSARKANKREQRRFQQWREKLDNG